MLSAPGESEPASVNARFIQALNAKSLETIRLTEALSLSADDETARRALAQHLSDLRGSAGELGLVYLEAALAEALTRLEQDSFAPASLVAVRMLAWRYEFLAAMSSRSGTHPVVSETEDTPGVPLLTLGGDVVGEPPLAEASLRGRRVLVAAAEAEKRWFYVGVLREAGARVAEARDGLHALEVARDHVPDLILADIAMPRLNGLELCAAVRREPALDGVPVVLLSWRDDFLHRTRELEVGAQDYEVKAVPARQILDRVSRVLEPLARLEERLTSHQEARGDLEELGVSALLRATRRLRPNATIVLQDSWSLFDLQLHGGHIVEVTRTAIDGAVTRGAEAFPALVGMSSGLFVVAEAAAHESPEKRASLDPAFAQATRRLSAIREVTVPARASEGEPAVGPSLPRMSSELNDPEIQRDSPPVADPLERENVRAQLGVAMHREPTNAAPSWTYPIWRLNVRAAVGSSESSSGFGMEMQRTPRFLGLAFLSVLSATVGFLIWHQAMLALAPAAAVVPSPARVTAVDEHVTPKPPLVAPPPSPSGFDLSSFAGALRAGVDSSLEVAEGQGVLEVIGPGDVTVDVDGIDRGALPVTLVLDEGRHTLRYRLGDRATYRFSYVKPGATRTSRLITQPGGFVDAR